MRFPRNVKIFRGQLDAAPLAGVFFLLLIFLVLASLVYTPGVPIRIGHGSQKEIAITKEGEIIFENRTYATNMLEELRANLRKLPAQTVLVVSEAPEAPRESMTQIRDWAHSFNLGFETPGAAIRPPSIQNFASATGPTAVVVVNIAGHLFFENQLIEEQKLQARLAELATRSSLPLTLVILADKGVEYGLVLHLAQLAETAGIKEVLLQGKPTTAKTTL